MKYRVRPVQVDAIPADEVIRVASTAWSDLPRWLVEAYERSEILFLRDAVRISSPPSSAWAFAGDWIIRGVTGRIFACDQATFAATYEHMADPGPPQLNRMRFTGENGTEIAEWCGGTVDSPNSEHDGWQVLVPTKSGVQRANVGDWVLRNEDGSFVVLPEDGLRDTWGITDDPHFLRHQPESPKPEDPATHLPALGLTHSAVLTPEEVEQLWTIDVSKP